MNFKYWFGEFCVVLFSSKVDLADGSGGLAVFGLPGTAVFEFKCTDLRVLKRNHVEPEIATVCNDDDQQAAMETTRPMMATDGVKLSWRDKLLNVQNGLHALDLDNFKCDLDDELDCAVTRGERGPSFQFSERAMKKMCEP
ncbi:hypothetical protein TB2_017593 [Malus domestica]